MFAPTLIYRDNYPRREGPVNLVRIISLSYEIIIFTLTAFITVEWAFMPRIINFGIEPLTVHSLSVIIGLSIIVGLFVFIGIAWGFLHCWLNIFAEILSFGDRLFYKEWWTSRGMDEAMRTWNFLIHSWITEYLYKPVVSFTGSRFIGVAVVLVTSAVVHDYIVSIPVQTYVPGFIVIVFGIILPVKILGPLVDPILKRVKGNLPTFIVFLCMSAVLGLMGPEYFASFKNCPSSKSYFLMPKSLTTCQFQS